MRILERLVRAGADFAGVLPRAHAAVANFGDWNPLTCDGARQFGEVVLDEVALSGFTLSAPPPQLQRSAASCQAAATELSALGVEGAHAEPPALRPTSIRRRRLGRQTYEQVRFEHDPRLPGSLAAQGFGGPASAVVHLCRHDDSRRPWLVWVHGAGQGRPIDVVFARARTLGQTLGVNVALPVQPGCGVRSTNWPQYPTMDPLANVAGMMRAVSEVRALLRWLRPHASALAVSGVSMGSPVAGLVAHLEPVDAVAVYTPIAGLNTMIAAHLGRWGPSVRDTVELLSSDVVEAVMSAVDYRSVQPSAPREARLVIGAWYDQMAGRDTALDLHQRWQGELYWHRGSHVGHLFAPGVHAAAQRWLRPLSGDAERSP